MSRTSSSRALKALALALALPAALGRPAGAKLLMSQAEALRLAFPPGSAVERKTAYLTEDQRKSAESAARVKIESRVWTYYVGRSSAGLIGYAYFDTHVVRTMPETLMAALDPDGGVRFVEILSFAEPDDYLANPRWLAQFKDKALAPDLMLHRSIRNLTGASLTSQAVTDALRRILAVHARIQAGASTEKVKSKR